VLLNAGDHAAIYADDGTGDVGGALAGEEGYNVGVLFRFAVAAEWDGALTLGGNLFGAAALALGFGVIESCDAGCGDAARHDDVGSDAVFAHFAS